MAKSTTDRTVINQMMVERQTNEQELSAALYELFNSALLPYAQSVALAALQVMRAGNRRALERALKEEANLAVYKKGFGRWGSQLSVVMISSLITAYQRFDASDCSDVIRLFGAYVEMGGGFGASTEEKIQGGDAWGQDISMGFGIKDAFRGGVQTGKGDWVNEVNDVWSDEKGRFASLGHGSGKRIRVDRIGLPSHIVINPLSGFTGMGGLVNPPPSGGPKGKEAGRNSNTLKIDKIFGLLAGADISGTTADTVFALEVLSELKGLQLSPIMYMLPLATIVYNAHHTMLEVALPLTLNGAIDYKVGFYSSLLPSLTGNQPGTQEIKAILQKFENDRRNHHLFCWYSGQEIAGCVEFDQPWEKNKLKFAQLSSAKTLLFRATTLPVFPQINDVANLVNSLAPHLVIAAGRYMNITSKQLRLR